MPQYDVTAPDGKTYSVNAPEGATHDDAIKYVQANFYRPTASTGDSIAKGLRDPIDAGAQLLTRGLSAVAPRVVEAGNRLNNYIADKTGLVGRLPAGGVDQQIRDSEKAYQLARGSDGMDWGRMAGNVLNPANLAIGSAVPKLAALAKTAAPVLSPVLGGLGVGVVGGAASGAMTPVTEEGDFATQKAKQMGVGALAGAAVPVVTGAVSRIISPRASVNPDVLKLKAEGVTPTIGQALGGRMNAAEEKLMSIPVLGDAISSARTASREQFNNAAINRAVAPIGARVEGTGQAAVKEAGDLLSATYDRAKSMLGGFPIDQQAAQQLGALRSMARTGLEGRERKTVEKYFSDYLQKPALTAESFKELDSKLTADIARYSKSSDAYQQKVGDALAEVKKIVTDNAKRANPKAAELFDKADAGWAQLVRIEGASKAAHNSGGVFTPAQLNMAIKGADNSVRDRATARGTALMQDLGQAGQNVLGNKVPNSGTFDRGAMGAATLGGSAYLDPLALTGLLGASAMYLPPMRSLLSGAVTSRPQFAQPVANALNQASPALIPLGAQVGLGLLN